MKNEDSSTSDKILDAAIMIFGDLGYKGATVREICKQAGAGIASVNYYFRDKEKLYSAVLERVFGEAFSKYPPDYQLGNSDNPKDKLKAFIRSFLLKLFNDSDKPWFESKLRLFGHEISNPSSFLEPFISKALEPHKNYLAKIMIELLAPVEDYKTVALSSLSVISQCVHHAYARPMIKRMGFANINVAEDIENIAEHIFQFSIGGIDRIKKNRRNI